ncbi:MAG: hypothetical protein LBM71_00030 [Elusimicrobiota bacterium]|jgi:hypothetical protein|nr:hypothetical protein [Elusimicrobiota bacterium]
MAVKKIKKETKTTKAKKTTKKTEKGAVVKKNTQPKVAAAKKNVCIDYPLHDDTISCGHYSFRVGAIGNIDGIKISVNGGPWQDCRPANGYWWYDWWNFEEGVHIVEALALIDGEEVKTPKRKFKVSF